MESIWLHGFFHLMVKEEKEMVKEDTVYHTFKKNVPYYNIGIRYFRGDSDGLVLTNEFPTVRVKDEDLREFKMANKQHLLEGKLVPVEEDNLDWETANAITDEQVDDLLKNYAKLKSTLQTLTSVAIVQKILTAAEEQDKTKKTISLIRARFDELSPDDEFIGRNDMQTTFDDTRSGE